MSEQEQAGGLKGAISTHQPRDVWADANLVGTECSCGAWQGDYFADGEAGPFDVHLADAVRAWLLGQRVRAIVDAQFRLAEQDCPEPQRWGREAADAVLAALTKAEQ